MQLGILTAPFPDTPLTEVADWAASDGFTALEVACWPASGGEKRRYAGTTHIDVDGLSKGQADEILGALAERGVTISGLGYYPNPLHADAGHREQVTGHLKKVITAAGTLGVKVVNTFVGGDRTLHAGRELEPRAADLCAHRQPRAGRGRHACLRELPDDLQP